MEENLQNQINQKLLWIDLEMTGLDIEKEVIIEVGAIITDWNLTSLGEYHAIVKQDQTYLDNMDEWNVKHHTQSGLVQKVPLGMSPHLVEKQLIDFSYEHFVDGDAIVIAGNTIHQDRKFLDKYFKEFAGHLHYRMLDVSSWKIVFQEKYSKIFRKSETHRALDDIKESIEELKYYIKHLKIDPTHQ